MKKSKVMKITAIAVVIVLIAGAVIWKMLGIRAEGTENQGTTQIDTSKWDTENRVNIVYDEDGVPVPVPKGYTASSILREFDGEGNKTKDGERTVNTGFVIYEGEEDIISDVTKAMEDGEEKNQAIEQDIENAQTTRNQWVWVPVPNIEDIYYVGEDGKKYGQTWYFTDTGRTKIDGLATEPKVSEYYDCGNFLPNYLNQYIQTDLYVELEMEFEDTINSINKYGGYYIGRYETGNTTSQRMKVVKGNRTLNCIDWYTMYRKSKEILPNGGENVKTSMIWRCLWDNTLEWLVNSGNKTYSELYNAVSWGNFPPASFDYKEIDGVIRRKNGDRSIPTGSSEYTNSNNIYDLAGNMEEFTIENDDDLRVYRGGSFFYYSYGDIYTVYGRGATSPEVSNSRDNNTIRYSYNFIYKIKRGVL